MAETLQIRCKTLFNQSINRPCIFSYFVIISFWKKYMALHKNRLVFPTHKDVLCLDFKWYKPNGPGEIYFQCHQCIFAISLLSPLGNGLAHLFDQTWNPLYLRLLNANVGWNCFNGSWEDDENAKCERTAGSTTNIRWSENLRRAKKTNFLLENIFIKQR